MTIFQDLIIEIQNGIRILLVLMSCIILLSNRNGKPTWSNFVVASGSILLNKVSFYPINVIPECGRVTINCIINLCKYSLCHMTVCFPRDPVTFGFKYPSYPP